MSVCNIQNPCNTCLGYIPLSRSTDLHDWICRTENVWIRLKQHSIHIFKFGMLEITERCPVWYTFWIPFVDRWRLIFWRLSKRILVLLWLRLRHWWNMNVSNLNTYCFIRLWKSIWILMTFCGMIIWSREYIYIYIDRQIICILTYC